MNPPRGTFAGLCTIDLAYLVSEMPGPNVKLVADQQELCAGGPATNAAVTFAFLGSQAHLITAAGRHPIAAIIRHDLARCGVALEDLAGAATKPPPVSSIFVIGNTGARTVVSATHALGEVDYGSFRPGSLEGSEFLLVDGHHMPLCIAAASAARQRGMRVILDGGSWKEGMIELLPLVDTAICSADFRTPNSALTGGAETGGAAVTAFLHRCGISQVAITRGPSGIRFSTVTTMGVTTAGEIPVPNVKAADTTGAGDIFHGAFCYYSCNPRSTFPDALTKAAVVASESCRHFGTRQWMAEGRQRYVTE